MKRALVLVMLVAACGGSSGGGKAASAKSAYLAKAEAICATASADLTTAKKQQPSAISAIPPYVHRIVDIAKQTFDDLSGLTPPSGDVAALKAKVLDPLGRQLAVAQAFAGNVDAAAAKKDNAALTQLVLNPPTKTQVDVAWMKSYGFKTCVAAADTGGTAGT
jgi:hypothetical protein